MGHAVRLKRAYAAPSPADGQRILVDRLWPRGRTKQELQIDLWLKEVAPSTALRKWFGHDPEKWAELQERYRQELKSGPQKEAFEELKSLCRKGLVTLVYGAKDEQHNHARILEALLTRMSG